MLSLLLNLIVFILIMPILLQAFPEANFLALKTKHTHLGCYINTFLSGQQNLSLIENIREILSWGSFSKKNEEF